jgi:porin
MQRTESADHDRVVFFGFQLGYRLSTPLGEGNYRVLGYVTTEAFPSAVDGTKQSGKAMLFSADQQISDDIGIFARLGGQSDEPAVEYDSIFSGGIDLGGALWGRPADNVGVGYAFLEGGSTFVRHSHVTEAYYRLAVNDDLALTADVQHLHDNLEDQPSPSGFAFGLRATFEF